MTRKPVACLLAGLGVTKTHSRPHVSNDKRFDVQRDNPFAFAQFKTLKYRPDFPERFGSQADARCWAHSFFTWYNQTPPHSGLGLLTPATVHAGQAQTVLQQPQAVLLQADSAQPDRCVRGAPSPCALPVAVWINPPQADPLPPAEGLQTPGAQKEA